MTKTDWTLLSDWIALGKGVFFHVWNDMGFAWFRPEHLFLIAGATFLLICFWILTRGPKNKKIPYTSSRSDVMAQLEDVSFLWNQKEKSREKRIVELKKLSVIWKNPKVAADVHPDPVLSYDPLVQFYEKYVKMAPYFHGAEVQKQVVIQELLILDKEGDVPSVIKIPRIGKISDPESGMPDAQFSLLARTSLRDHSLHVAMYAIQAFSDQGARHIIPDAMIAALAHDFGKLPSEMPEVKSTGNHVLVASRLQQLEGFIHLKHGNEILLAIKGHHTEAQDRIGKVLSEGERDAREQEALEARKAVATYSLEEEDNTTSKPKSQTVSKAKPATESSTVEPTGKASQPMEVPKELWTEGSGHEVDAPKAIGNPTPTPEEPKPLAAPMKGIPLPNEFLREQQQQEQRPVPKTQLEKDEDGEKIPAAQEFDEWFDLDEFLQRISKAVNRLEGKTVIGLSRPQGEVYITLRFIDQVLRIMADNAGYTEMAGYGENSFPMRAILLRLMNRLRERKILNENLVDVDSYGLACVTVLRPTARQRDTGVRPIREYFFLPLWGTVAWGEEQFAEFEGRKKGILTKIIAVVPREQWRQSEFQAKTQGED